MELSGSVLNVVDFGAFVDIGLHDSGLVHVSQLANRYVRDPHEVVSVGDIVKVWELEIDKTRRRVSLTMIPPGTKKPEPHFRRGKPERRAAGESAVATEGRPARPHGAQQPGGRPPRPAGGENRPPRPQPQQGGAPSGRPQQGDRGGRRGGPPAHLRPHGAGRAEGGRGAGGRGGRGGGHADSGRGRPYEHRPKAPAKPLPPITKKMIEGKEPMRTFGDLMQFMKVKKTDEPAEAVRERRDLGETAAAGPPHTGPAASPPPAVTQPATPQAPSQPTPAAESLASDEGASKHETQETANGDSPDAVAESQASRSSAP
jgi:uncharacterized protein